MVDKPNESEPINSNLDRAHQHGFVNAIVGTFLHSNLSVVLILLAAVAGFVALIVTPREEDPQIIVPLADVYVNFPGHSAQEVEQLVATPLEKLLYHIDGVEYVYSMSKADQAIITVRFYVGEDREKSLVKLYKRIDENLDIVPPGVTDWIIKPVEIDDVPIVTLTLTGSTTNQYTLRRVAEELVQRMAAIKNISRAYVVGGQPRVVYVYLDPVRMEAYGVAPSDVHNAIRYTNIRHTAGSFRRDDQSFVVEVGPAFDKVDDLESLVIVVAGDRPVFLKDVADVIDGPAEITHYVRHGRGPSGALEHDRGAPGSLIGPEALPPGDDVNPDTFTDAQPAVTIALAKKKGTNAVWIADEILDEIEQLKADMVPDDIEVFVTRNYGRAADEKVNELVESLAVAVVIVIGLLAIGLGWREGLIVALAVPVVFGLTLTVNLMLGFTINRVTLFALILSIGLLVDDPIVDVENISRHFAMRKKATRRIVLEAVAEIRPPLIIATLAVIVSFLPLLFITGMMGPFMRPMAMNVPVTMIMSMVVAFTITPWLSYHLLRRGWNDSGPAEGAPAVQAMSPEAIRQLPLYRIFTPLMKPLLTRRSTASAFLLVIVALTLGAVALPVFRTVPLKMLPYGNKNKLLFVLDFNEGTTLQRTDAAVREIETFISGVPEVVDFTSYVGIASPMDFNAMVRHYYLRKGDNVAEIRVNLIGKKSRSTQSHAIGLRIRDDLVAIARRHNATLKIVETPPGPPVLSTIVAEVYGGPDLSYADLVDASRVVRARLEAEPSVVDVDDTIETNHPKWVFSADAEKAAINGVSVAEISTAFATALAGRSAGILNIPTERNPLPIVIRVPRAMRSSPEDLGRINVKSRTGKLVPLAELGSWHKAPVEQTLYHKNLRPVTYVTAETAGRPPSDVIIDVQADRKKTDDSHSAQTRPVASGWIGTGDPTSVASRSFITSGGGIPWAVPDGIDVEFAGEGEWKITIDVFRDLGIAFAAALIGIYILLIWQTGSFIIPVVVMLAIPLTIMGIMPGFWLLNLVAGNSVGSYADPIFFTATAMIGMIALAGIVTRNSIILVDFIHIALAKGQTLPDAILNSCVVRLRPILLTAGTAMLSAVPIAIDPVFSGLAWALIFGLFASTLFTLFVVPVSYWLVYANKPRHGLPATKDDEA